MPKKRGYKEDTRGLKAKAQKAAAQAEKDARRAREVEEMEASDWARAPTTAPRKEPRPRRRRQQRKQARARPKEAEGGRRGDPLEHEKKKSARKAVKAKKAKLSAFERQMMEKKKRAEKRAKKAARLKGDAIVVDEKAKLVEQAPLKPNENSRRGAGGRSARGQQHRGRFKHFGLGQQRRGGGRDCRRSASERRMKAAFAAFKDRESQRIRNEYPGLKRTQIDERVWKLWQKSDESHEK